MAAVQTTKTHPRTAATLPFSSPTPPDVVRECSLVRIDIAHVFPDSSFFLEYKPCSPDRHPRRPDGGRMASEWHRVTGSAQRVTSSSQVENDRSGARRCL